MELHEFEVTVHCPVLMTSSVRTVKAYDEADAVEQQLANYPHGKITNVKRKEVSRETE